VLWNLIENLTTYILKLAIGIILARLLTPGDFGLIGITVIFFSIAEVFITNGLGQAFIQKKEASEIDANTIFVANLTISILIYLLLWVSAPAIASYFNQPDLTKIVRVLSVVIIFNAITIIQIAIIRKNIEFRRKTIITIISSFISGIIGIFMAYSGFGVWSLVIQQVMNKLIFSVYLHITSKWKMKLEFSYSSFKSLFQFSFWLLLNGLFTRFFDNMYRLVIGKYDNPDQLGFFDRGQQFPGMIYQQISWSVGSVAFPVYSKLLDDPIELKRTFTKFVKYSSLVTIPFLAILFIIAEPFIIVVMTDKWIGSIIFIKLFCIIGVLIPFYDYLTQFVEVIGKTKYVFAYTVVLNIFRLINVLIFFNEGILNILLGEILLIFISILWVSFYSKKIIGFNFLNVLFGLKRIFLVIAATFICGMFLYYTLESNMVLQLVLVPLFMVILYIVMISFVEKGVFRSIMTNLSK